MRPRMSFHERAQTRAPWRNIPGLQVTGVAERPTGVDERIAVIFRDMRMGLGASVEDLAHALGTTPDVIATMEGGYVRAFPPWPETVRIVTQLGKLHRVDTRPILARIRDQVGPAGLGQVPQPPPEDKAAIDEHPLLRIRERARAAGPRRAALRHGVQRVRQQLRRTARALFAISAPVAIVGGTLWLAQAQPGLLLSAVTKLPEPAQRVVRPVAEFMVTRLAPWRDGMRWIEVADPRTRKADKLRQASR